MALKLKTVWQRELPVAAFGTLDTGGDPMLARILGAQPAAFPPAASFLSRLDRALPHGVSRTPVPAAREAGAVTWAVNLSRGPRCGATVAFTVDPRRPEQVLVRLTQLAPLTRRLALGTLVVAWFAASAALGFVALQLLPRPAGLLGVGALLVAFLAGIPAGVWAMLAFMADDVGADEAAAKELVGGLVPVLDEWAQAPTVVQVVVPPAGPAARA